jgi:uncharacterized protein (TIGR02246 family)
MTRRATIWFSLILTAGAATLFAQPKKLSADDYLEIQQLYARYNTAIDSGDAEGYTATFTPDGVFNTFSGHDALVGFIKQWREQMKGASRRHWNTNLVITPTAEGASGTVYLFLMDVSAKPPAIQATAKYEDQLVKTADGWRFKHRQTKPDSAPPAAPPAPKQ